MSEESEVNGVVRTLTTPMAMTNGRHGEEANGDSRYHLYEILSNLKNVMMISSASGTLEGAHGRPMNIAQADTDGTLYFLTSEDSVLVSEVKRGDVGICTGQTKTQYVSIEGRFEVRHDPATVAMVWSLAAETWFPKGKSDPKIRVVVFRPSSADIWDMSGTRGLSFLLDVAKSWMTGHAPEGREVHSKIST